MSDALNPNTPLDSAADARQDQRSWPGTLMQRLDAMRRRARHLLTHFGVALAVFVALTLLGLLVVLDYLLWFPAGLRLALSVAWLLTLTWVLLTVVWRPLHTPVSLLYVASKIEEQFTQFQDRLTSSVSFLTEGSPEQDPLQQEVIERTRAWLETCPMEAVISTRPAWRMTWLAAVPLSVALLAAVLRPQFCGTGIQRYVLPLGSAEWPKKVRIEPLTRDLTVARGESVVVSMRITRGSSPGLRGFVYTRRGGQKAQRSAMRQEGPDRYAWTLNAVTEDLTYWFEAGDDATRKTPGRLRVVSRPRVADLRVVVQAPPYTRSLQPVQIPSGQKSIDVIAGGSVAISFRSTKPLATTARGVPQAWVQAQDQERVFAQESAQGGVFVIHLSPPRPDTYTLQLVDAQGFDNSDETRLNINVVEDAAPTAAILKPLGVLQVTPAAVVHIRAQAMDDLGISRIQLAGRIRTAERSFAIPIEQWLSDVDRQQILARVAYDWRIAELAVQVGDLVAYRLQVEDNRATDSLQPQQGRSYTLLLRVVSESQFRLSAGDELKAMADQLRRSLKQQEKLIGQTDALSDELDDQPPAEIRDADLLRLSAKQRAVVTQVAKIRRHAEELAAQLERNGISSGREVQHANLLVTQLQNLIERTMQQAGVKLNEARKESHPLQQGRNVRAALDLQRRSADALRELLSELARWDDYNAVVANIRDIADTQQQVSQQTAMLQGETLGQDLQDLSEELRRQLEENARRQQGITAAIEKALGELDTLRRRLRERKPEDAGNLAEMGRKLKSSNVRALSEKAAQAIRRNQTGQAQEDQDSIERALAEAVSEVQDRQSRRLAELSKRVQELEEIIAVILQGQIELNESTRLIGQEPVEGQFEPLAWRQRQLQRNTTQVVTRLEETPETASAAQRARLAAEDMELATEALYEGADQQALPRQERAIEQLQLVLAALKEIRENAENTMKREKLMAIKRALIQIRKKQLAVNQQTEKLVEQAQQRRRLSRRLVRRARQQAKQQEALLEEIGTIEEKLTETPVYLWVTGRVTQAMTRSAEGLRERRLDGGLQGTQQRIVALLNRLIEALQEVEAMARNQFAESGGGGGGGPGGAQAGQQKPVPTIAELIVLKGIQQDIHQRTRQLHERMDSGNPSEQDLQEVNTLGTEQAELRDLTQALTQKAREGR